MSRHELAVCGRCGVYRYLHPTERCAKSRRAYWLDEHYMVMHVTGWAWSKVPEKARWWVVGMMHDRFPGRWHWCDLVEVAMRPGPMWVSDYDDWCDLPTPFYGINKPPTTACYCNNLPYEVAR